MQDIAEKLKSFSSQAGEGIGKGLDTLKSKASEAGDYLQANPTLAAMLLAGGGAGLLGGYLTSRQPEEEGESKASRRLRILRNALLAGGAGAGVVGLGAEGLKRFSEATPLNSENPVQEKLNSPKVRAIGGVAGALFGANRGAAKDLEAKAIKAKQFLSAREAIKLKGLPPVDVINHAKKFLFSPETRGFINVNTRSQALNKIISTLIGASRSGQLARAGGAAGMLLPELIKGTKNLFVSSVD